MPQLLAEMPLLPIGRARANDGNDDWIFRSTFNESTISSSRRFRLPRTIAATAFAGALRSRYWRIDAIIYFHNATASRLTPTASDFRRIAARRRSADGRVSAAFRANLTIICAKLSTAA